MGANKIKEIQGKMVKKKEGRNKKKGERLTRKEREGYIKSSALCRRCPAVDGGRHWGFRCECCAAQRRRE